MNKQYVEKIDGVYRLAGKRVPLDSRLCVLVRPDGLKQDPMFYQKLADFRGQAV